MAFSFAGDTRPILRVCRGCGFSLFCRHPSCPVCGEELEVLRNSESDLDLPTLDELHKPFLGKPPEAIENFLHRADASRLTRIRFANVEPDRYVKHFMAHKDVVGVCDFCDVVQVSSEKCRICRRRLRFQLKLEDTQRAKERDFKSAEQSLKLKLDNLGLHESALLLLARGHTFSDGWVSNDFQGLRRDLMIQISRSNPAVEEFFKDVADFLERQDDGEFEEFILRAELKRAKVSAQFLLSWWSEDSEMRSIWGDPDLEWLSSQIRALYFDHHELFVHGMELVAEAWRTEKALKKKERLEAEHQARMALYAQQRENSARPKDVSDWWLNREEHTFAPKQNAPYVSRSWKNRWRKPW